MQRLKLSHDKKDISNGFIREYSVMFNNHYIGVNIEASDDGFFYASFDSSRGGLLDAWVLRDIAELIEGLNKEYIANLDEYFLNRSNDDLDDDELNFL